MSNEPASAQTDKGGFSREDSPQQPTKEISHEDAVYRNQKGRYPWWVKSIDEPTIEIDRSQLKRMHPFKSTLNPFGRFFKPESLEEDVEKHKNIGIAQYIGVDKTIKLFRKKRALVENWLHDSTPGFNHEDWALYYAAYSVQYNLSLDFYDVTDKSAFVNVKES